MACASRRSRMRGTAAAASSLLTVTRTNSEPARERALTCATVPSTSAVSVLVIDCTTIGAAPPMVTAPTLTPMDNLREIMPAFYLARGGSTRARCAAQNRHNGAVAERIVYSTGLGTLCPNCRRAVRECVCPKGTPGAAKPATVRVGREVKGRAGKGVTTVAGLPLTQSDIEALAAKLKKRCGSGGTVREGVIEVQGDHRDVIVAELNKLGWPAKKSGG